MKKITKRQNVENVEEAKLNLKGINMKNYQTKLFVNKIVEVAKIDENVANELMAELRKTKTLSAESKKKIVNTKYQSSPIEEIENRLVEESKNALSQQHVKAALSELRDAKIAKFQREEKKVAEKRLVKMEATGNDFLAETAAAARAEMRRFGYLKVATQKNMWATIC
jgi:hypothetical protein